MNYERAAEANDAHSARLYIGYVVLGAISVSVLVSVMLFVAGARGPSPWTSDNSKNLYFLQVEKARIAHRTRESKLVVVGGSSALYSVRSVVFESAIKRPVVNLALQAGLGLDYILHDAQRNLRSGDVVLLVLEHEHFLSDGTPQWAQADFSLNFDPGWFIRRSPKRISQSLTVLTARDLLYAVLRGVLYRAIDSQDYLAVINAKGDLVANTLEETIRRREALDQYAKVPMQFGDGRISKFAQQQLTEFVRWCNEREIAVLATLPPFLEQPEYETNGYHEFVGREVALYRSLGVTMVEDSRHGLWPREMFFDTWYHLNATGAETYSESLARELSFLVRSGGEAL